MCTAITKELQEHKFMNFTMSHDKEGFFEVKISGNYDHAKIAPLIDTITSHKGWQEGARVLFDETALNLEELKYITVNDITDSFNINSDKFITVKFAILVSRDLEFGINRMWSTLIEDKADIKAYVFKSKEKAIQWLLQD